MKIPSIEEYIDAYYPEQNDDYSKEQVRRMLKGFADMHVKAALGAATLHARAMEDPADFGTGSIWVDKDSILDAYPLSYIK